MLQVVKWFVCASLATMLLTGCDKFELKGLFVPTGDTVDARFEESMALNKSKPIARIESEDAYLFYVCADAHIKESYNNLREFATLMRNDPQAPFGVMLGDCIDKRNAWSRYLEAIEHIAESQPYDTPIFSVLGNHDLYFAGWENFVELIGPSVYWFEVEHSSGQDLFIVLDSASGTLGGKQMAWLEEFLSVERERYRHCIVLKHTNLFYTDLSQNTTGNMPLEESTALFELFSKHKVTLCLQGHDHNREDLTFGGVRYTIVGTLREEAKKPEYLVISVSDSGLEYEWNYL